MSPLIVPAILPAILPDAELPIASLPEETARLKQASLAAEKILFSLTLLNDNEFAVLENHGMTRSAVEAAMFAGAIARRRVTLAEQEVA